MQKYRKNSLTNSAVLAFGIVISKISGALYKIPLVGIIGAEGIGKYQQIFSAYAFLLTVTSGAVSASVSRAVGEKRALGLEKDAVACFNGGKIMTALLGLAACFVALAFAYPLSVVQKSDNVLGYVCIAPALIFACLTSAYRGYFQGKKRITETTLSQFIEQAIKTLSGLALAKAFIPYGIIYAVCGSLLGVTLSEITAFLYLAIKANRQTKDYGYVKGDAKPILRHTLKTNLSASITPAMLLIDGVLVVWLLSAFKMASSPASEYGLMAGVAHTIINVPTVVIMSLPVALTPFLSEAKAKRDLYSINGKIRDNLTIGYIGAVFFTVFVAVFSLNALSLLFPSLTPGDLLKASKLLVIMSFAQIFVIDLQFRSSLLQALGITDVPLKILTVSALFKLVFTFPLIYKFGVYGAAASTFCGYAIGDILMHSYYRVYFGRDKKLTVSAAKTAAIGAVTFVVLFLVKGFISNNLIKLSVYGIFGAGIYLTMLKLSGVLPKTLFKSNL